MSDTLRTTESLVDRVVVCELPCETAVGARMAAAVGEQQIAFSTGRSSRFPGGRRT